MTSSSPLPDFITTSTETGGLPADLQAPESFLIDLSAPVVLRDAPSAEPILDVSWDEGILLVGGIAGGGGPSTMTHGGFVWTSTDQGESFQLVLDPRFPADVSCSCDVDVIEAGGRLYATTFHVTYLNPLYTANLVASDDGGRTWETVDTFAAEVMPIDRPWLTFHNETGRLVMTYRGEATYTDLLNAMTDDAAAHVVPAHGRQIMIQSSTDGGVSWSSPTVAVERPSSGFHFNQKPAFAGDTLLLPVEHVSSETGLGQVRVARSTDGGRSFNVQNLSEPHRIDATFDFSLAGDERGHAVVAWAQLDDRNRSRILMRTSEDAGASWSDVIEIDLPGAKVQPSVAISPEGYLAIAYYASSLEGVRPSAAPSATEWHAGAFIAPIGDLSRGREVVLSDVAYRGPFCNLSPDCSYHRTELFEFLTVDWAREGVFYVGYTDTYPSSDDGDGWIAVVRGTIRLHQ